MTLGLRVQLDGAFPPVWRRIEVASDLGLDDLHDVLQVLFGWQDYHLHRFATGPQDDPGAVFACTADLAEAWEDDPSRPTWDVRVDELLAAAGERLHYQYDYGDNWWLAIEVEDVVAAGVPAGRARLLEGAGAGPPEDCGGIHGYRIVVAAADPSHPDHRTALAEVASWWGREVAPDELGLVPFDPVVIGDRLQALDLDGRPPVPARVGEKLAALLMRTRDAATERRLRALAASADGDVDVDAAVAEQTVRPLRVLLGAVGDGVKLTAAGYLPPAVVSTIFEALDLGDEWIGKPNREDLTVPVLALREAGQRLKLVRKYNGRLVPTPRGKNLADNPVGLWWHVAASLPLGGRGETDAEWQAGVLLLALMAAGSADDAAVTVAELLTGLGWAVGDREPVDRRTASGLFADDVHLLHRLGAFESEDRGRWPGPATPGGTALARAALAPWFDYDAWPGTGPPRPNTVIQFRDGDQGQRPPPRDRRPGYPSRH
ncbi:MAG: plasmid pRiA4b ORF-3 family protein [Actinobacteria bacterium]|nr:plasmid pRiA4b ORF-3 family protein [Actinomycetota bacterium]